MNATFSRLTASAARAAAACLAALTLASCGGGGVSPSPNVPNQAQIVILPSSSATAPVVAYSGLPTTFSITGGNGSYIVASNNQAVIASPGGFAGSSFTIVPLPVTAETTVTLSVRDTATAPPVTVTIAVRSGTVNNNITITPSATQDASCAPAICSGGDAEVRVTLSQGGIPLPARGVRFDVVSGNFNFIVSPPGAPEQIAATYTAVTDETGIARARIRVTAGAPNQTALLQVTDLASGAYRTTSFAIAQFNGNAPAFFTLPSSITYTGPYANVCAGGATSQVSVFGGSPPYAITGGSSSFSVSPSVVGASGGSFTITLFGGAGCFENAAIGVTDASGRTITVTLSNVAGTGTAPAPAVSLAPSALTLSCSPATSSIAVIGGSGTFAVGVNHPRVVATVAARTVTLERLAGDAPAATYPTTGTVTVTDGNTAATATLTVPANCP